MKCTFRDSRLWAIEEKLIAGDRLDFSDGLALFESNDLIGIGRLADTVRRERHDDRAYYVYNQHLNYTNVCTNGCLFCAFAQQEGAPNAFTLTLEDAARMLQERLDEPVREIHIVGGLNPVLGLDYYLELLRTVKRIRPKATIKAFTAVEIDYLARTSGYGLERVIELLKAAGLEMIPGGGAEVMSERVWRKLFPRKINGDRWLEVMQALHRAGLSANATMLYGHIETLEERVGHLIKLRELQDQTAGFSAFIPLAFHSENTRLSGLPPTTGFDDLKTIAVARLMLDNFDHIKAYWVMIGEKLAQVALAFGADDLDGTIIHEKITHMAGAQSAKGLTQGQLQQLIREAGFEPVERDSFYHPVQPAADTGWGSEPIL